MMAPRPHPWLLPVCVVVGLLCGTAVFLAAKVNHPPQVDRLDVEHWDLLGTMVPEVALRTLDGAPISSRHFMGEHHLLFFSSPGCGLCDEVYPALQAAAPEMAVLMVAQHGLEETRAKVAEYGLTFPVAYDSMGVLTDPLRVSGHPATVWVSADGAIRKAAGGRIASQTIIQLAVDSQAH